MVHAEEPTATRQRTSGPASLTVSLSGGGYRAAVFSAGALLAVADTELREHVTSVSSVSGGSIASAVTAGGFADPSPVDPDPMAKRVRILAGLAQTDGIDTERFLKGLRLPLGVVVVAVAIAFLVPSWDISGPDDPLIRTNAVPVGLVAFPVAVWLIILAASFTALTLLQSQYAVHRVVEGLVGNSLGLEPDQGATLADLGGGAEPRRIFCATDLSGGSHVYLSADGVQIPGMVGSAPQVFVADAVAASACFPGFRPIVFTMGELGLGGSERPLTPRTHRHGLRMVVGVAGFAGAAAFVVAVALRVLSPYLIEPPADSILLAAMLAGAAVAAGATLLLRLRNSIVLVDGGVSDNLGAAFALLSQDARYPQLPSLSGVEGGGSLLVVDASKPFSPLDLKRPQVLSLVPLRLRAAQRSALQLLGNANSIARKQAIRHLLAAGTVMTGRVVSIETAPDEGLDPETVAQNARTPTTLGALAEETVGNLLLQSYRLTQEALQDQAVVLLRRRADDEIRSLANADSVTDVMRALKSRNGPYQRLSKRSRWVSLIVVGACYWVVSMVVFNLILGI